MRFRRVPAAARPLKIGDADVQLLEEVPVRISEGHIVVALVQMPIGIQPIPSQASAKGFSIMALRFRSKAWSDRDSGTRRRAAPPRLAPTTDTGSTGHSSFAHAFCEMIPVFLPAIGIVVEQKA